MSRIRPIEALLAALATITVAMPLFLLFAPGTWFRPAVVLALVVALVGMAARAATGVRGAVLVSQVVALVLGASWIHLRGHLWAGLIPLADGATAARSLLGEAYDTVVDYSAPAPTNRGVSFAIGLLVGLIAIAVDGAAATYRSPAVAGVPLLVAFLAAASNSGGGLSGWYVVAPAVCWLTLVGTQGVRSIRAWGAPTRERGPSAPATSAFATTGRAVGAAAVAAAVAIPAVVPHLPTTFLADGLATSEKAQGGSGPVRLATSIDIAQDLGDRSPQPVLRYRTTADAPAPLRVGILDVYRRGQWQTSSDYTILLEDGRLPEPPTAAGTRRVERMTVESNAVAVPQVALPDGAFGAPFPDGAWRLTANGVVELSEPVEKYSVDYIDPDPEDVDFAPDLDPDAVEREDLAVDPRSEADVRALLEDITAPGDSAITVARSIQAHLRGADYTYSLDLADDVASGALPEEPLARFLETKSGYCVQFATAMIMLSRAAGIPARMAVGFLPGTADAGRRVVRASDAHAWPELYFPRLGWMRFEPTPGGRAGGAPGYSLPGGGDSGPSPTTPSPSASASAGGQATGASRDDVGAQDPANAGDTTDDGTLATLRTWIPAVVAALVVLIALLAVPFGAWWALRRARRRARDDAELIEAEWAALLLRLSDIGLAAPDGATPRQASRYLGARAYLEAPEHAAFGAVVDTVERARYTPPGRHRVPDMSADARRVWRAAHSRRRIGDRARARLWPEAGRRHWRAVLTNVLAVARRHLRPAADVVSAARRPGSRRVPPEVVDHTPASSGRALDARGQSR
jgi:transglutaminase-like putative cysteine protease